jgi:hypothetical protein
MRGGIKRPKDTAITRDMGEGGCQSVNVSMGWEGRLSEVAKSCIGTVFVGY